MSLVSWLLEFLVPQTSSSCLLASSFRYYFIGSLTLLFTFPSRYSSTIGHDVCLALPCGQGRFNREFAVSQPTQESPRFGSSFVYRTFTFFGHLFQSVLLLSPIPCWSPTTPSAFYLRIILDKKKSQSSNSNYQTNLNYQIDNLPTNDFVVW